MALKGVSDKKKMGGRSANKKEVLQKEEEGEQDRQEQ